MEIAMINEHEFQQDLEATALPALDSCMHDGYMDPAVSDWHGHRLRTLHPADGTPNKLHVVRYDVEKFHALQIPGSSRQTHGTVLISHGFTEFAAKYKEMAW
ncbi:alpha/beta hydrolase, partial [Limosilactobacillus reuteri]